MRPSLTPTYPKRRGCKSATTDWAHHVRSSSGPITIVVMTLPTQTRSPPDGGEQAKIAPVKSKIAPNIMHAIDAMISCVKPWSVYSTLCRLNMFDALLCTILFHVAAYRKHEMMSYPGHLWATLSSITMLNFVIMGCKVADIFDWAVWMAFLKPV